MVLFFPAMSSNSLVRNSPVIGLAFARTVSTFLCVASIVLPIMFLCGSSSCGISTIAMSPTMSIEWGKMANRLGGSLFSRYSERFCGALRLSENSRVEILYSGTF